MINFSIRANFAPQSRCINEDDPIETFKRLSPDEMIRTVRALHALYSPDQSTAVTCSRVNNLEGEPVVAIYHMMDSRSEYSVGIHHFFHACRRIMNAIGIRD